MAVVVAMVVVVAVTPAVVLLLVLCKRVGLTGAAARGCTTLIRFTLFFLKNMV